LVNDFLNYYYRLNGFLWHPRIFHSYFSLEHLQAKNVLLNFLCYEYNFKVHTNTHALLIIFVKGFKNTKAEFPNNAFSQ